MDSLEDYDILTNGDHPSSTFIAHHKSTGKNYTLQSIPCTNLSENDLKTLMKKIKVRTSLINPNVLQFYNHIRYNGIIYLKQEFCAYGTLSNFIQRECIEKRRQLHEDFLYRILYQTVFALKTVECLMGQLDLDTVMLTEDFNVKLYNFYNISDINSKHQKQKEIKVSQLGAIIFNLSTLRTFEKSNFEEAILQQGYSESFKVLLISFIKENSEIRMKHINKILCDPTVLLQSSQWCKEKCFIEPFQYNLIKKSVSSELCESASQDYAERLERLRKREAAVQLKEQLLKEQERLISQREKKLQIMEKAVKDKLQQAELYLKRCREGGKSISSGSSRSSLQSNKTTFENVDPDYVSCGDSDVFPTSNKLQVDKIIKPKPFSRTMSERRIRFKVSPLKENLNRRSHGRKTLRHSKILEEVTSENVENIPTGAKEATMSRRKSLFLLSNEYENELMKVNSEYDGIMANEMKNVGWTKETKKHAFEMLRIMNDDNNQEIGEIKHTFL